MLGKVEVGLGPICSHKTCFRVAAVREQQVSKFMRDRRRKHLRASEAVCAAKHLNTTVEHVGDAAACPEAAHRNADAMPGDHREQAFGLLIR